MNARSIIRNGMVRGNHFWWVPTDDMKVLGFEPTNCGVDGRAAWDAANELNREWDKVIGFDDWRYQVEMHLRTAIALRRKGNDKDALKYLDMIDAVYSGNTGIDAAGWRPLKGKGRPSREIDPKEMKARAAMERIASETGEKRPKTLAKAAIRDVGAWSLMVGEPALVIQLVGWWTGGRENN